MTTADRIVKVLRPEAPDQKFMADEVPLINQLAVLWDLRTKGASTRKTSPKGIALIHSFESCKLKAYPDPGTGGKPFTIGWGSTTDEQGNPIAPGTVWTQERADSRFALDLAKFEQGVSDLIGSAATTQGQFDAMVSIAYNIGLKNFQTSTLLKMHKAGNFGGAFGQFARWNKAADKVMNGLVRRRAAEAELYAS